MQSLDIFPKCIETRCMHISANYFSIFSRAALAVLLCQCAFVCDIKKWESRNGCWNIISENFNEGARRTLAIAITRCCMGTHIGERTKLKSPQACQVCTEWADAISAKFIHRKRWDGNGFVLQCYALFLESNVHFIVAWQKSFGSFYCEISTVCTLVSFYNFIFHILYIFEEF